MNTPCMQKVIVVGATGLIGSEIVSLLEAGEEGIPYEVMGVTNETSPGLDLEDLNSIEAFFHDVEDFTHVIVAAGEARFGSWEELDAEAFALGLRSKLMGQVNIAMAALRKLPEGGSVTLTSGALSHTPIPGSAGVAMVNGALDSFVQAIALDVTGGQRINIVSPGWIKETMIRMGLDPTSGTSARDVARLYLQAIQGTSHGRILEASDRRVIAHPVTR